ncbi:MAG: glycosyltransferase family 2 protein [Ignavibacteriae bacterium]|nr:glycosyltransferase family 2 protein [Ignavibacteriota bacterium]
MKFSVLLPTRNRLELLKTAIYSVQNQDYDNWEIIVSDNFSEQDIGGYVRSLNDLRIKYFRTPHFISVTDNWNHTIEKCSGDYIIMLGDDDCLLKNYFTNICQLIKKHPSPDMIYTSGFTYAYPGALRDIPEGFLHVFGNASFLQKKDCPFWLPREEALKLVEDSMNFKVMFAYNMQYALLSRRLMERLMSKGTFFQSPYPDYYAMTAMMLNAERIVACPIPLVAVGISPKSFGALYFNRCEKQGNEFLKNSIENFKTSPSEECLKHGTHTDMYEKFQKIILPGTTMNTFWLFSMERIKENYENEFDLKVNYKRYRFLQMVNVYKSQILQGKPKSSETKKLWKEINWKEKLLYGMGLHFFFIVLGFVPRKYFSRVIAEMERLLVASHPQFDHQTVNRRFSSMQQVFDEINPSHYMPNS